MKKQNLFLSSCLVALASGTIASAQSIDYGTLESLFGEPVTASATGKPQRVSDAPVAMDIITSEEIRRSGAKDIPQLLQRIAGVEVNRSTIGRADVGIRGYNQPYSNRLLTLINGRQAMVDSFGFVPWENLGIQMSEIRQIEVVKGPQSALFGFNAESGVINIITFNPLKDDVSNFEVKIGTQQHREGSVVKTTKINDDMAVRVSAGLTSSDTFNRDGNSDNARRDDNHMKRNVSVDYEWQVSDDEQLRLQGIFANGHTDSLLPFGSISSRYTTLSNLHMDYKIQADSGLWTFTAYQNTYDTGNGATGYQNDLTVVKAENLFQVGANHSFRLGAEYRYNRLTGAIMGGGNSKIDYDLWAPSAMWDWQISPKMSWTNSVRYDYVNMGRDETPSAGPFAGNHDAFAKKIEDVSFNTGVRYALDDRNTLRFSAGKGMHIPSLIEMGAGVDFTAALGVSSGYYGNPQLETERSYSAEIGYDHLFEDNTKLSANLFWRGMENVLGTNISYGTPLPMEFEFANTGDSQAIGLELGLAGTYNNWLRWGANYTAMSIDDDVRQGYQQNFEQDKLEHQVSLYGGFDKGNWEFDGDLNYVSGRRDEWISNPNPMATDRKTVGSDLEGYFVLNARVGYKLSDQTDVALTGYNLIDKHREWYNGADDNGNKVGGDAIGRSVLLTLQHRF